jgi:hypothetical protein
MIIVSADDHQPVGVHDGDREDALVQAGDERRLLFRSLLQVSFEHLTIIIDLGPHACLT